MMGTVVEKEIAFSATSHQRMMHVKTNYILAKLNIWHLIC